MSRVWNFSAGPSCLPEEVLKECAAEMLDCNGTGQSVMEMSHRSSAFEPIIQDAEKMVRKLMKVPDNYKILFVQGGGSTQFAMVAENLGIHSGKAAYIETGVWAKKAAAEAKKLGIQVDVIKKICLCGIGRVGTIVAERIIEKDRNSVISKLFGREKKSNQSITIIDTDYELCEAAKNKFPSANVVHADITDDNIIEEERLDKCNLLICATHNHELNMVISAYLESLGVEKSIVLVNQSQYGNIARRLGIEVAIPMRDTLVDSIISHLHGKSVKGIHTVSNGEFEIIECDLSSTSKFAGQQLKDIANPGQYLVLLIKKPGSKNYELPQGNTVLASGDHLVIIQKTGDKKVLEKFSK